MREKKRNKIENSKTVENRKNGRKEMEKGMIITNILPFFPFSLYSMAFGFRFYSFFSRAFGFHLFILRIMSKQKCSEVIDR